MKVLGCLVGTDMMGMVCCQRIDILCCICVQFSIIAYLMYFFGVLFISLGAASIFFLAFETPFARVEKILVRTCQHISQI